MAGFEPAARPKLPPSSTCSFGGSSLSREGQEIDPVLPDACRRHVDPSPRSQDDQTAQRSSYPPTRSVETAVWVGRANILCRETEGGPGADDADACHIRSAFSNLSGRRTATRRSPPHDREVCDSHPGAAEERSTRPARPPADSDRS